MRYHAPMAGLPEIVLWHHRFFGEDQEGHSANDVEKAERALGCRLPEELRALQLHTWLRDSQQLHLEPIDGIRFEGDVLVFMREQQDCWQWGIPRRELTSASPRLMSNPSGAWADDGCTLDQLLRFFVVMNRPYEGPCTSRPYQLPSIEKLRAGWQPFHIGSASIGQKSLWIRNDAVLDPIDGDSVLLGAASMDGLESAAGSLGLEIEDDDIANA